MRVRVVCGFGLTMLTFWPSSAFSSVDLPTFGRPTSAAKPQRTPARRPAGRHRRFGLSWTSPARGPGPRARAARLPARRGAGSSPSPVARSAEARRPRSSRRTTARAARRSPPRPRSAGSAQAARLQLLLQPRLGILERLGRRAARRRRSAEQPLDHRARPPRGRRRGRSRRTAPRAQSARIELAAEAAGLQFAAAEPQLVAEAELRRGIARATWPLTSAAR